MDRALGYRGPFAQRHGMSLGREGNTLGASSLLYASVQPGLGSCKFNRRKKARNFKSFSPLYRRVPDGDF